MRKSYANPQQQLGQFMTPPLVAKLLASQLPMGGSSLLELGAGSGSLIQEVRERLGDLDITAVEVDLSLVKQLRRAAPEAHIVRGDVALSRTQARIATLAPYDYAIGNPPYAVAGAMVDRGNTLEHWKLHDIQRGNRLDTLFLAQSLSALKEGGAGAFILPLTLFSDRAYTGFRAALMERFSSIRIIELPANIFSAAEVATAICRVSGARTRRCKVELGVADAAGRMQDLLTVKPSLAVERMDYGYHKEVGRLMEEIGPDGSTLQDLGAQIVRGSATAIQLQHGGMEFLHTSDLPVNGIGRFRYASKAADAYNSVKAGDIVVPRVGSRCLLRQAIVVRGEISYTESVYRVRIAKQHRERVLNCLASSVGETWRRLHARGSCAKHITVSDLLRMPISA